MKKYFYLSCMLVLAACGGDAKENLGLNTNAPDEFAVERRPRLDVPPAFRLRPPTPGEAPINAAEMRDVAKEKIIGSTISADTPAADKNLLQKAGAQTANPDIRDVLTKEYPKISSQGPLEKLRSISDKNVNKTLVDAEKEKKRIEENKKDNKPITEGETPSKSENEGKSLVDKVFN